MPRDERPPKRTTSTAQRLAGIDFDLANASRRVIEGALAVVPGDRVLIVVDQARRDVGAALLEMARAIGATCDVAELESFGARPHRALPAALSEGLHGAQVSVLVISAEDAEVGLRRELLEIVKSVGLRHAHMIGVTRKTMIAGFSVDPGRILDATRAVRTRLRADSVLHVRSAAGSDLEVKLGARSTWAVHDGVIRPGRWENLPAGELTTSPVDVNGTYVVDASIGGQIGGAAGILSRTPLTIEIEGGLCKGVESLDRGLRRDVLAFLAREHNLNRVGTITLGTNVGILVPTGEFVCDQNMPGLHVAFGSVIPELTGASFQTRAQLMMTSAASDIDLDGAPLMRRGRYLVA